MTVFHKVLYKPKIDKNWLFTGLGPLLCHNPRWLPKWPLGNFKFRLESTGSKMNIKCSSSMIPNFLASNPNFIFSNTQWQQFSKWQPLFSKWLPKCQNRQKLFIYRLRQYCNNTKPRFFRSRNRDVTLSFQVAVFIVANSVTTIVYLLIICACVCLCVCLSVCVSV